MANAEIKKNAKEKGVKLWKIADVLGISDCYFSKKLRKEFTPDMKTKILTIIEELSQEQEAD